MAVSNLVYNMVDELIRGITFNTDLVPRVWVSRVVLDHVETDILLAVQVCLPFVTFWQLLSLDFFDASLFNLIGALFFFLRLRYFIVVHSILNFSLI